jgi:hypothetical protein
MTLFDLKAKDHVLAAARADYTKMTEIAKAVYDNPRLLKDFERDPSAAAFAINGFRVPEGMHIHIADAENNFTPAEEPGIFGDERRDSWNRVEVRAGYKTFSLVACG